MFGSDVHTYEGQDCMGITYTYRSLRTSDLPEILRMREVVRATFPEVRDLQADDIQHGSFNTKGQLPLLKIPEGIGIPVLLLTSVLPRDACSFRTIRDMLFRYQADWNVVGDFSVDCVVGEEPATFVPAETIRFAVGIRQGRLNAFCWAQGTLLGDLSYRRQLVTRLIGELGLPLRMKDDPHGYYLEHAQGGSLFREGGSTVINDQCFRCELPRLHLEDLPILLSRFSEAFASGAAVRYEWGCSNVDPDASRPDLGKELYDWCAAAGFPMERTHVDLGCQLSDLRALDGLRQLCGRRGTFLTPVVCFRCSADYWAWLDVTTAKDGHYVTVSLQDPEDLPRVQSILNLPLRKNAKVG